MQLIQAYQAWRNRRAASRATDEFNPACDAVFACDVGFVEERRARAAAGRTGSPSELTRLMRLLSLDPEIAESRHPSAMRDMRVACACCMEASRCREDLDRGRHGAAIARYCPNAEALAAIGANDLARPRRA
jgi:hypothetical protein